MVNHLDGSGIYRQDAILGPFDEDKCNHKPRVPRIVEIRAINHEGEVYYNARDMVIAMKYHARQHYFTVSVLRFIKGFVFELITARR